MKTLGTILIIAACGCVSQDRYNSDMHTIKSDLHWQLHELRELQKDIIEMRRGYRVIPMHVSITNDNAGVWREN